MKGAQQEAKLKQSQINGKSVTWVKKPLKPIERCFSKPIRNPIESEKLNVVDDETFLRTWKAFGGYTRDLCSFGEEIDKITTLHRSGFKNCSQSLEMASQFPSNDVRSYKRRRQNVTASKETLEDSIKRWQDENPIRTLEDYSRPSHEGYRNTIELPDGNNVVTRPLRSDTIRLVQNGYSFHGLRSEDPNQHLKDFLKLVDSLNLDVANRERTHLRLFQFSLRYQASNWLERLPAGSIST
ncbi:hypothetical protein Tco_0086498 [Tanacetum coccineum]